MCLSLFGFALPMLIKVIVDQLVPEVFAGVSGLIAGTLFGHAQNTWPAYTTRAVKAMPTLKSSLP